MFLFLMVYKLHQMWYSLRKSVHYATEGSLRTPLWMSPKLLPPLKRYPASWNISFLKFVGQLSTPPSSPFKSCSRPWLCTATAPESWGMLIIYIIRQGQSGLHYTNQSTPTPYFTQFCQLRPPWPDTLSFGWRYWLQHQILRTHAL